MERPTGFLIRDHLEWLIESATEQTHGDITKAAKLLGVDRGTLSHWVNHGLTKKYYRGEPPKPHVTETVCQPEVAAPAPAHSELSGEEWKRRVLSQVG